MTFIEICAQFGIDVIAKKDVTQGLINRTSIVKSSDGNKYVLQEINHNVFRNVRGLMNNVELVTEHLSKKAKTQKEKDSTLRVIKTINGENYVRTVDSENNPHYYRMYNYIENASSYDEASEELLFQAGVGFGRFQKQLADFDATKLVETIPNFHNTVDRFMQFNNKYSEVWHKANVEGSERDKVRIAKATEAVEFAYNYSGMASTIMTELGAGTIPLRVVHNDTKLNNIMVDNATHEPVCVVDLDTIMPGSVLFDFGDAVRFACNNAPEDERDLRKVNISMDKFSAFTKGFLQETHESLTEREVKLLPLAPAILAYELGLRFLTDYLDGDKYFKCDSLRPDHNLERATSQFMLASKILQYQRDMEEVVQQTIEGYRKTEKTEE